jgi:uncharacterized protein
MAQGEPERIHVLDVLRGLALFGMFLVHFHGYTTEPGGIDDAIRVLIWRLVETKSHGTFALLFGAGFAIQLRRAEARGEPFAWLYLRRLAVLATFGFAAHAFFGYNVLLGYAVWALPLLLMRSWSTRALIVTAVISTASVTLYRLVEMQYVLRVFGPDELAARYEAQRALATSVNAALEAAESQGSYAALLAARLRHMSWFYAQPFSFTPSVTLALFITGLLFVRHRVFEAVRSHRRLLVGLALFGVVSWLAGNWLLDMVGVATSFGLLRDQWLTFTYVSLALLLFTSRPGLLARLRPIGNAGRMALTNYLLQIATLDLLFSGYAFGLGQIRPVFGLAAAITSFAVEVAWSTWWLTRFRFGPAEWLWRSLTYGRAQSMRRDLSPSTTAVSA